VRIWWYSRRQNGASGSVLSTLGSPERSLSGIIRQFRKRSSANFACTEFPEVPGSKLAGGVPDAGREHDICLRLIHRGEAAPLLRRLMGLE
jgi:hypothetical protein